MSQAKLIPCLFCKELVAANAKKCPICSTPIDADAALSVADAKMMENMRVRRKHYARHMMIGGGLFGLGLAIFLVTYTMAVFSEEEGGSYIFLYGMMVTGGVDFLYGLAGWLGELN
jgi:hypothetical protein